MNNYYLTFGQGHVHSVQGVTFDKDTVVLIKETDEMTARKRAFATFGPSWCMLYSAKEFENIGMHYFPRGIIELKS